MKKAIIFTLFIAVFSFSCKKEGCTDATASNFNSEAKTDDGSCTFSTVDTTNNGGGSTDTTSTNGNGGNNGGGTTAVTYPSTYIVVNTDTMWMVSRNQNFDASKFRYQVNFGTKEQLKQNAAETGSNSTVGLVMSYAQKPSSSSSYNYTSSRFNIDSSQVNFYASFFLNTGYSITNKNFLSPDTDSITFNLSGSDLTTSFGPIVLTDEASSAQTVNLSGVFDFSW